MESRMDEKLKIDFDNVKYELETSLKQVYGVLGTKVDNVAWWDANDCLDEKLKFDFDNVKYELGELKNDFDNVKCEVSSINDLKKVSVDSRLNVDGISMSIEQGIEEVTALNGHFAGTWADASGEVENDKPDNAVDGDVEPEEELNVEQSVAKSDFEPRVDKTVDTAFAASVLAREVGCQAGKRRRKKPVSGINHVVNVDMDGPIDCPINGLDEKAAENVANVAVVERASTSEGICAKDRLDRVAKLAKGISDKVREGREEDAIEEMRELLRLRAGQAASA